MSSDLAGAGQGAITFLLRRNFLGRPHQTTRSAPSRTPITPKTAPFSVANHYNPATTRKPIICQFRKTLRFVSTLL
jgi:hypothetical protein